MNDVIERFAGGLIVSCQAPHGHPLRNVPVIVRLAQCARLGGAAGVRVNSPQDVSGVRAALPDLPIIGLHKEPAADRDLITPRWELIEGLVAAGADVIAFEATDRCELPPEEMIGRIRNELGVPTMADVATAEQGLRAWEAGADLVSSTLSGYTPDSPHSEAPDFALVGALAAAGVRTVAEGRLTTPDHLRVAFGEGAHAVVVGTAITDPVAITRRLAAAAPQRLRAPGGD